MRRRCTPVAQKPPSAFMPVSVAPGCSVNKSPVPSLTLTVTSNLLVTRRWSVSLTMMQRGDGTSGLSVTAAMSLAEFPQVPAAGDWLSAGTRPGGLPALLVVVVGFGTAVVVTAFVVVGGAVADATPA